jgi:hypothetical protein
MTTTRSGIMKIPQRVVAVSFYSLDVMREKFQPVEGFMLSLVSE